MFFFHLETHFFFQKKCLRFLQYFKFEVDDRHDDDVCVQRGHVLNKLKRCVCVREACVTYFEAQVRYEYRQLSEQAQ